MNRNQKQLDTTKKTVYFRLDYSWYMMGAYLDMLRTTENLIGCSESFAIMWINNSFCNAKEKLTIFLSLRNK